MEQKPDQELINSVVPRSRKRTKIGLEDCKQTRVTIQDADIMRSLFDGRDILRTLQVLADCVESMIRKLEKLVNAYNETCDCDNPPSDSALIKTADDIHKEMNQSACELKRKTENIRSDVRSALSNFNKGKGV